jgi:DNA polymerase III delta subunit
MDSCYKGELGMTVADVKKDIQDKTIKQYYVFTGDELEVMNIFINKIAEVAGAKICRADTLSSVFSKLQNKSFFSTKTCFVIRDDKEFMSAEEIWPRIERAELQSDNIVIMLYTDVDKRSKFYKHIKDSLVTFEALTDANLKREIQKRIALSDRNCDILIDICEHNLGIILNEIDKIRNYISGDRPDGRSMTYDQSFEQLLKDGTIHQPARDCIWDFVDAVLMRKKKQAFGLLEEALEFGNPVLTLISVLYRDTKQLLQVQMCPTPDISKSTGLSGFDIKRASGRKFKYKDKELVNAMNVIREAEMGIKSGNIEENVALEYILVNMM